MKRIICLMLAALCCVSLLGAAVMAAGSSAERSGEFESLSELEGRTVIVQSGTTFDQLAENYWNDITIQYSQSMSDGILALQSGKGDAILCDETYGRYIISMNDGLVEVDESLEDQKIGIAYQKNAEGQALCDEFNVYIDQWRADGTLDAMLDNWTDANAEHPEIDLDSLTGENGTIRYGTEFAYAPFDYVENNEYTGFDMDLIYRLCKAAGYQLEISSMSFDALIPSLTAGKVDVIANCITITEERAESVTFSNPVCDNDTVALVRSKDTAVSSGGFFSSIGESFTKTFITDSRWQLFLRGIGKTLLITLCSLIFGTILGFLLYMWCWSGRKIPELITGLFAWLMSRMPIVVLLMILFYVVFGSSSVSGTVVAIIGFTMVFGGSVFGLIRSGVGAVDPGQMEAGLALGYTRNQTFFRIILPQAIMHFMPGYKGEVVSLIKSTAIVGYVAVEDLTKVSDLIRSRTFEAFFPLIATAIIYLILAELLILLVSRVDQLLFPRNRTEKQLLKGVKTDD